MSSLVRARLALTREAEHGAQCLATLLLRHTLHDLDPIERAAQVAARKLATFGHI